jgi:hypothetical protein
VMMSRGEQAESDCFCLRYDAAKGSNGNSS